MEEIRSECQHAKNMVSGRHIFPVGSNIFTHTLSSCKLKQEKTHMHTHTQKRHNLQLPSCIVVSWSEDLAELLMPSSCLAAKPAQTRAVTRKRASERAGGGPEVSEHAQSARRTLTPFRHDERLNAAPRGRRFQRLKRTF